MHDIRKPYIRSRSSNDLNSRVEQFESRSYAREEYDDVDERYDREDTPVRIPVKRIRRDVNGMDMYPKRRREEDVYEDDAVHENSRPRRVNDRIERRSTERGESTVGTWAFIITVLVLVVGAGLLTYVFDSATVTIVPKHKDVSDLHKTVTFTKDGNEPGTVPYTITTSKLTKSKSLSLSESRKVEAKAGGKVTIYNNYDAQPQKLIKNTRLESKAGKIYRINQSVTVPGKKGSVPGSVEVTVYADSYGAGYNTPATDFTIPGFKGTSREKAFYGKSKSPITGGSSGNVSLASLSDLNAVKDELAIELAQQLKAELMKIKKDGYIGLYSAAEITYSDNEASVLSGATGVYEVTATGYLMMANASKLAESVAKDLRDYENEPVRLDYTETVNYTRKEADHLASSTEISLLVEGKPRVVWLSDADAIKEMVKGKKRDEFKPIMKKIESIEGAEISFSPLWLSTFPSDMTKISITESLPKR